MDTVTIEAAPAAASTLNLDYLQAAQVVTRQWSRLTIALVGCGGTGSWLAPSLARIAAVLREAGREVDLAFIDPDMVEQANIPRQNFCAAELGRNKAAALALRYGAAWGLDIRAVASPFEEKYVPWPHGYGSRADMLLIVGCVDNAAARKSIASVVAKYNDGSWRESSTPGTWWLDCGNMRESGQVLLGSAHNLKELAGAFTPHTICKALPMPSLQMPDLLEPLPEEVEEQRARMSCAQLAMANAQSLMVNQAMASVAADYALRLATGGLRRFATYVDLPSATTKSLYTTPEAVARVLGKGVGIFDSVESKSV